MSQRPARLALWSALGLALLFTGYLLMNTTFMPYDDEGFLLISYRNYLAGLRLYDDVFSQYGPWPYLYHQFVTTLLGHAPVTHTLGRALTLLHWVGAALLCGGLAWRLTRSQLAAGTTALLAFGLTWQMISEPSHPGSLIAVTVAAVALVAAALPEARRPALHYAALGVGAGLLLMTKVNVGLLLAAGTGCLLLVFLDWPPAWRWLAWAGPAGLLALPWVLIGRQLHHPWAFGLAAQFTLAAAGLLWLAWPRPGAGRLPLRPWLVAPAGTLLTIIAITGWVLLRGTTLRAMIRTVILDPTQMPGKFLMKLAWFPEAWVFAACGALLVARAGWELRHRGALRPATFWAVIALRGAAFALFLLHASAWPSYFGIFHFVVDCLPLLPVFLVPLAPRSPAEQLARWGAACIALPQLLHVFPVAGSQAGWGSFLFLPLLVAGLWELREVLPPRLAAGRRLTRLGGGLLAGASVLVLALMAQTGWQRYTASRPLGLAGAEDLRLDGRSRQAFRLLALNASIHADLLVTCPGMYSHNLWSGVPAPTAQNATHWMWLLSDGLQQERIDRLAATPRTALILSHSLTDFLVERHLTGSGPMNAFLEQHYRELFRYGDFSFELPAGMAGVTFGRYELQRADRSDPATPPLLFRTNVVLDGRPAHIRLEALEAGAAPGPELLTGKFPAVAEPIDREGRTLGGPLALPATQPLRGLYRLTILAPLLPASLPWQECALVVRAADGRLLSESAYF